MKDISEIYATCERDAYNQPNYTKTQKSSCTWKKHFMTDGAAAGRSCHDINIVIAGLKKVKSLRVCSLSNQPSIHVPSCQGTKRKI